MHSEMESLKAIVAKLKVNDTQTPQEEKKEDGQNKNRVLLKPSGLSK